jgi:peptidoglycan/xylan/chitin deacetylase (PgdA/CDA1 family)/glycosyltransferase involved in cell wall biosynthesis
MKILHLSPYSPIPPIFGGALRVYHILRGLAKRHEVTFVTFGSKADLEELKVNFGNIVKEIRVVEPNPAVHEHKWLGLLRAFGKRESYFFQYTASTAMQVTLDQLFQANHFDATVIEFPHMGNFRFPVNMLTVLDEHNVEYKNFFRMYKGIRSPARKLLYYREHHETYREEINVCRRVSAILTTSQDDMKVLDEQVPGKTKFVIPNGVDVSYFVPSDNETEPYSMIFTGTMDYVPNQDGMLYFLDQIFPLIKSKQPKAKIYIVGKNPPESLKRRSSSDIIITGYVDDVRPYTEKASVYVVPLRMGSGTRLKILEGLAMKKPIVTTSIGCEGIDVTNGKDVVIADNPSLFADEVVNLFTDKSKSAALGASGYKLVTNRYNWEAIASSMDEVLTNLVRDRDTTGVSGTEPLFVKGESQKSKIGKQTDGQAVKVLMYHRVVGDREHFNDYLWNISQSQFRKQLSLLKKWGYSFIDFKDYLLSQEGKINLPKKSVILTFDDGYNGVYKYALPTIKEFGAKATAFVLGDRSIKTNYWDEPTGFTGAPLLEDEKVLELAESGFEIGSHSLTHPNLTHVDKGKAWEEIARSKDSLESLLKSPVVSFAYPFGASNVEVQNMVREAGYHYGCGVYSGPPKLGQNKYNIRRISVMTGTNIFDFALKILTPYEYYQWLRWETSSKLNKSRFTVARKRISGE